jgi:hypothetical protein
LATFFFEGKKHVVAAPLDPILIIGAPPAAAAAAGQPVAPGLDTGAEGEEDPEGWDKFEEVGSVREAVVCMGQGRGAAGGGGLAGPSGVRRMKLDR